LQLGFGFCSFAFGRFLNVIHETHARLLESLRICHRESAETSLNLIAHSNFILVYRQFTRGPIEETKAGKERRVDMFDELAAELDTLKKRLQAEYLAKVPTRFRNGCSRIRKAIHSIITI
jgi:hypothetical protein